MGVAFLIIQIMLSLKDKLSFMSIPKINVFEKSLIAVGPVVSLVLVKCRSKGPGSGQVVQLLSVDQARSSDTTKNDEPMTRNKNMARVE
jgi:hypothetical protein